MATIKKCVFISEDKETHIDYFKESEDNDSTLDYLNSLCDSKIEFLDSDSTKSFRKLIKENYYLIIEDESEAIARLIEIYSKSRELKSNLSLVICADYVSLYKLIEYKRFKPIFLSLDFYISEDEDDFLQKTKSIVIEMRQKWTNSTMIGFSNFVENNTIDHKRTIYELNKNYAFWSVQKKGNMLKNISDFEAIWSNGLNGYNNLPPDSKPDLDIDDIFTTFV